MGDTLQQIAQLFDRDHSYSSNILPVSDGISPPESHRIG